jgi:hypothetical protein
MDVVVLSMVDEQERFISLGKEYGFVNEVLFKE